MNLTEARLDISSMPAVEAESVSRRYGGRVAVNGVSLSLAEGDCLALFGPNGAGKTTLLRLLGGLLSAHSGAVYLYGRKLPGDSDTRRMLGVLSHRSMLYEALTVRENVVFAAECQGVADVDGAVDSILNRLMVADRSDIPVARLSRGLQQRVSIAKALVHEPRLILLDEPYTGLDEIGARALTSILRSFRSGGATIILVTHNLSEGLELASQAVVMRGGEFVHKLERPAEGYDISSYSDIYRALIAGSE